MFSPSEAGVAPDGIVQFLDAVERDRGIEPHGLIIQRHGRRIAEGYWAPHTPDRTRLVYSLSKSFTGTALGLQIAEGRLDLDDLVSDHLPDLFDGDVDDATRRMRIRHIASMSSGHDRETFLEALVLDGRDPVRGFLHIPPDAEPGTRFAYNQPPVLALATILQHLCGARLVDYLRPRLLDPIGIGEFRWTQWTPGVDLGFSGVHTNLDAVARLGQLYLNDGVWNDGAGGGGTEGARRILPPGWVAEASRVHVSNSEESTGQPGNPDWQQGYGFQLWRSRHGYRGDGAFGQFMVVLPEVDAVVAMFSCTADMQAILDLMWEHLLPAMGDAASPPTADDAALARRLDHLALPTVAERKGGAPPFVQDLAFGPSDPGPTSHRSVTAIETRAGRMVVHDGDEAIEVPLTDNWSTVSSALAVSATSLDDGRLAVDLAFLESPHRLRIELDSGTEMFRTHWPLPPLFGAGFASTISSMCAPAD